MDKSIAISVKNVSKNFKVYFDKGTSLKEKILFQHRRRFEERKVLKNISFEVMQGEAVGLIGENGSGKSTMLKLLTKIMYPTSGVVEASGRVSALIELGAGFHPDMSGRENIYTNAAIFGLSRDEIDQRLQVIIDFSELGDYIDNPVRTYSSGMYMRLAFSVAINVDADILLVDEILAVGDAAFQAKCFNRLREIKAAGTTIVIVSHSLSQIEQICDRSIWICDGRIREMGLPQDIHPAYMDYMGRKNAVNQTDPNRWGNGEAQILEVHLLGENDEEKEHFKTGEPLKIVMEYCVNSPLIRPVCGIGIFRNDGLQCYGTNTLIDQMVDLKLEEEGSITFSAEHCWLLPGEYSVEVAIHAEDGFAYDYYRDAVRFSVYSDVQDVGVLRMGHQWLRSK